MTYRTTAATAEATDWVCQKCGAVLPEHDDSAFTHSAECQSQVFPRPHALAPGDIVRVTHIGNRKEGVVEAVKGSRISVLVDRWVDAEGAATNAKVRTWKTEDEITLVEVAHV